MRPTFTDRERQLIVRILAGNSNREIAERLGLKEQTVRNRLTIIFAKCRVSSRLELALYLSRNGFGDPVDSTKP